MEGTLHKDHEDRIAGQGIKSLNHQNFVHKFVPMPEAMTLPDAKAAVDKEWETLEKIPARQLTNVTNKKKLMDEARKEGKTVHFASLMDICHLKNSELEPKSKNTTAEWYSEETLSKMIQALTQYLQSKVHLRHR